MIAIYPTKQELLDAYSKAIHKNNFIENLGQDWNISICFYY